MCGIVAIHAPDGGLAEADALPGMAALRARGPDGSGVWCSPTGRAVLGHTRLAVIDPDGGRQPIADEEGHRHLVANGEFYDYRRIRRELADAGHVFRTRGDSEIALHLHAREGHHALDRLRGEFAFVIWDERTGELFAARDRFGVKPLYYARHQGRLLIASEIKALLACGVPARWDTAAFAAHLQVAPPPDRTLFAGISQLPPGCYLVAGSQGVAVRRYWDLDYPLAADLEQGDEHWESHVEEVRAAIEEAVRVRMIADVPVAYHLSGGLDSTSVVATAARHDTVTAFTVRFDDPAYDESEVAERTARRLGVRHHQIDSHRADFAHHLRETVWAGESVQENAHGIARYLHSRAIRGHGFKVVLGGEGGDEIFAGYPQFQKDLALGLSPDLFAETRRGYRKLVAAGAPQHLRTLLDELGFVPSWVLDRYLSVTSPVMPLLRPEFAAEVSVTDACAPLLAATGDQLAGRATLHQSTYLFAKSWLPHYILASERLDAAQAVEARLPFFDHHLFAVARRTPLHWYTRAGATKYPLRAAMADRLPAEVSAGRKRGFFAPPVVGDDGMVAAVRDLARGSALRDNPFFRPEAVVRLVDRLADRPPAQRATAERLVQLVGSVGALAEEFGLTGGGTP
uniref:asparagine synthase (glutamine-hydrolyzing) n=1 Tax=Streptoalloteichus hindustanus TaxID=2017 RepID=A4KUB6_STRHI|nr:Tlm Orf21 [Streptoalloteichus hindustanus]